MEFNRESIIKWVKAKLGYPVVNIEISDTAIDGCIDDALDEISPWVVLPKYLTVPASQCIDLSEHGVKASYIIAFHKTDGSPNDRAMTPDVFNPISYQAIQTNSSMLHSVLELNLLQNQFGYVKDNISYKYIHPKLYLDVGIPRSSSVTIEYSPCINDISIFNTDDDNASIYRKYIKQFTLAFTRRILSEVRGKYTLMNTITELDASTQSDRADAVIEELRTELKEQLSTQFITD